MPAEPNTPNNDENEKHAAQGIAAPGKSNSRQSSITQISSILALTVSFLALAIGAYQTRLMQNQARASVWPYLSIGFSHRGDPEHANFTWTVDNSGVGPARIESVSVTLDGNPMHRWSEIFDALQIKGLDKATVNEINGKVLPPNTNRETTIPAINITENDAVQRFYDAKDRFGMTICYCSVYDECWVALWRKRDVRPVARCELSKTPFEE